MSNVDKNKIKKSAQNQQDSELTRFGHTVTLGKPLSFNIKFILVNKNQAVLFGGAKGASSKYDICDDSFLFKIDEQMWIKLNRKLNFLKSASGQIPCPRAAHAAASAENNRLIIFGGAIVGISFFKFLKNL